jgi:hypothetical protein
MSWPFPTPSGPTPWTRKKIREYEKQKRDDARESPL